MGIIGLLAVAGLVYWQQTAALVKQYEDALKLVGYVIGPLFAIVGYFWGRIDKAELVDLGQRLGEAKAQADEARSSAKIERDRADEQLKRIERLESDLATVADASRLWKLRANAPFAEYKGWKFDPEGAKIVTVGLFKGGVGKTHLAANFAAYVSETQKKPVLLVDLDYQGSLSTIIMSAAGIEPQGSLIDTLLAENADLATHTKSRVQLVPVTKAALNKGNGLSRSWLVPADYTLAQVESRLLVGRVVKESKGLDERYRLAHILLNPDVRRQYAMIIIDTPPRMTLGTVNALVSSHHLLVPVKLDRVSAEAVGPFLRQVSDLKRDLELQLNLAGVIGTLTRRLERSATEDLHRERIVEAVKEEWGLGADCFVAQSLPIKAQVTNEDDLGYFLSDDVGPLRDRFYDSIFNELWTRIMSPKESG